MNESAKINEPEYVKEARGDFVKFRDKWMKHVLSKDWLSQTERLIAIRIALYANFDDKFARPSIATIAIDSALSKRTIIRAINKLEAEGLLFIERRKRGVNRYWLTI
ncbi:helix-turn-helix domain-containing protein [Nitratireductor indicus]|uniref:helix-turn-helix domain-containing protein n=1 Tax=Nitratireductor indicus TaxID=721133 RepID=UPI0028743E2A|nr:helix-turn-helix domain-containing protein [Nitratireductor indicus]MDS1138605.1 helix-turn-helix domain-containing protein [Nitratireductor indicus]